MPSHEAERATGTDVQDVHHLKVKEHRKPHRSLELEKGYKAVGNIGKGAFGVATVVSRTCDKRQFVMKTTRISNNADERRREASIMSKLHHPGIVEFVDTFTYHSSKGHSTRRIVMEYCQGETLSKFLSRRDKRCLPERAVLEAFAQIAMAVHFCHMNNIMHRDLKTDNIFLTNRHMEGPCFRLGDFGVAKEFSSAQGKSGRIIGSLRYMPPEMVRRKPYGLSGDVWSLGVVLYRLATLQHAFDGDSERHLVKAIKRGEYRPLDESTPQSIVDLLGMLLRIEPDDRPSMQQLLRQPILRDAIVTYAKGVVDSCDHKSTEFSSMRISNICRQFVILGFGDMYAIARNPSSTLHGMTSERTLSGPLSFATYFDRGNIQAVQDAFSKEADEVMSLASRRTTIATSRRLSQLSKESSASGTSTSTPRRHNLLDSFRQRRVRRTGSTEESKQQHVSTRENKRKPPLLKPLSSQ